MPGDLAYSLEPGEERLSALSIVAMGGTVHAHQIALLGS